MNRTLIPVFALVAGSLAAQAKDQVAAPAAKLYQLEIRGIGG